MLAKLHLTIGVGFLLFFLATGGYMLMHFPELYAEREEVRMMYRASHIYLLMAAMVNLMAANYLVHSSFSGWWGLAKFASFFLLLAPFLFALAFLTEPQNYNIDRPFTFWAVVLLFAGSLLHTLRSWVGSKWCN